LLSGFLLAGASVSSAWAVNARQNKGQTHNKEGCMLNIQTKVSAG